ncbi:hypothetical protein [Marinoscillum furvescens]|uniref:Uncharacterized protein n=1 Tax=Marinoscillum furvescens DSM 4134 TaxID=1122208 RepID=A0A3D9KYB9_MARFU|nr:hypothetical protein [Marinoscillum furvescens]RED92469.1 hypothetical protein C7460_13037 [Marinoscillum furvescens DSM 4134]
MKTWFLFILVCSYSFNLVAQKCDEFAQLYETVIREFPEVSYDHPTKDRKLFDRISYNLISDKYFTQISKKSFVDFSEKEVERLKKKLFKCADVNGCWQLRDYLYQVFLSSNLSEVKSRVSKAQTQRSKLSNIKTELKSSLSLEALMKVEKSIKTEFGLLTTVELNGILDLISSKKEAAADKDLILKKDQVTGLPNTFKTLAELDNFKHNNSQIYRFASSTVKSEMKALIENKRQDVLESLAVIEVKSLEKTRFEISEIEEVNRAFEELKKKYRKYEDYSSVKSIYEYYKEKKTYFVSISAYDIAQKAEKYYTVAELDALRGKFLSNTKSVPNIEKLDDFIQSRIARIEKYLREEEEKRRREELVRVNLIKEKKAEIAQRRKDLKIKYESSLPTIEDIFDIMRLGSDIKDRYYTEDGKKFIRRVENLGYMQVGDDLYSDINTFRNSRGWEIYTVRLDDERNNQYAVSGNFKVKNAPRDIIELYMLELTTEYRKSTSPYIEPWEGGELKAESGSYVKSGTTFYKIDLEGGDLRVTALDNLDAKGVVVAEKIGDHLLKITPWTNYTHISLKKGDEINLSANGSITLGVFSVPCYPNGISGFRTHNVDGRYNHGCLIGKIGDGDWFYVGTQETIAADRDGLLQLRINDNKESDNDGHFEVRYSFK